MAKKSSEMMSEMKTKIDDSDSQIAKMMMEGNNKGIIVIENSYKKVNIDLDKIFEKGYSTKLDKEDHGLGLWNVRRILNTTENLNLFTKMDK